MMMKYSESTEEKFLQAKMWFDQYIDELDKRGEIESRFFFMFTAEI